MLQAIKSYFIKEKQNTLVKNLPAEPLDLVELGVCSVKSFEWMEGDWRRMFRKNRYISSVLGLGKN